MSAKRAEQEYRAIEIINYGPLREAVGEARTGWNPRGVKVTEADQSALRAMRELEAQLEQFYEPTKKGGAESCGDSRSNADFMAAMMRDPAPKLMGGSTPIVVVYGLVNETQRTFIQGAADLNDTYARVRAPFGLGDHLDCGGLGAAPTIIDLAASSEARPTIKALLPVFVGERYDGTAADVMLDKFGELSQRQHAYLPEGYNQQFLEFLHAHSSADDPVETLVSEPHEELTVGINRVPNTTFSKDMFNNLPTRTTRNLRRFSVDSWYPDQLARKYLYRQDKEAQREFAAGVGIYNLATLMVLTDGSLDLSVRDFA